VADKFTHGQISELADLFQVPPAMVSGSNKTERVGNLIRRLDPKHLEELVATVFGDGFVQPSMTSEGAMKAEAAVRAACVVDGPADSQPVAAPANVVAQLGFKPIVLDEQADAGRTIIEKFEAHAARAVYAVVMLTADDIGASKASPQQLRPRARQNVILELGYFAARLGRAKVCAVHESGVEIPSDYAGVLYVPLDSGGAWKLRVAKEMKAVGLPVDLNHLSS
jgi:predicted nucleotide-binding protein